MTDKEDLFVGLMAADIDPVTAYVVAESEAERENQRAAEPAVHPGAPWVAVVAILGLALTCLIALLS